MSVNLLLMIVAFVLLVLAALNVPSGRVSLGWAGMSCWALSMLLRV